MGKLSPQNLEPVYFIQAETLGHIKIGCAANVKARLARLQCGSPDRLRLIGVLETGGEQLEKSLHREFAESRLHGEWFTPSPNLVAFIARFARPLGEPPIDAWADRGEEERRGPVALYMARLLCRQKRPDDWEPKPDAYGRVRRGRSYVLVSPPPVSVR